MSMARLEKLFSLSSISGSARSCSALTNDLFLSVVELSYSTIMFGFAKKRYVSLELHGHS